MKKYFFFLVSILFLIGIVQATTVYNIYNAYYYGTFKPNSEINIINPCSNSSFSNITTLLYPNRTTAKQNIIMTKNLDSYNYTFKDTNTLGVYLVFMVCDKEYYLDDYYLYFLITRTGQTPADDNLLIFIYLIFIMIISLLIYTMVINVAKTATIETTVSDVAISWGLYFVMLTLYYLARVYIIDDFILNFSGIFLSITAFTHVVLPLISLILTMFIRSTEKKRLISVNEFTGRPFR